VGSNQDRKVLWVVGADDTVSAREVTVGQKLGTWIAVAANDAARPLTTADRIVVRGLQRCREGKPVKPTAAAESTLNVGSFVVPERREPAVHAPAPQPPATPAAATQPAPPAPPAASVPTPAAEPLPAPGETPR